MEFISRQRPTSDELPPWAGIAFKEPVDSDPLAESLKTAYPKCRTLRERKHCATIEFFLGELAQMQSQTLEVSRKYSDVASEHSRKSSASVCSPSSTATSPAVGEIPEKSPSNQSQATYAHAESNASFSGPQQIVWSALNGASMQLKTKRKMTADERSAYKETRKRGACDKCRRLKGRCTHMQDQKSRSPSVSEERPSKRISIVIDENTAHDEKPNSIKTEQQATVQHDDIDRNRLSYPTHDTNISTAPRIHVQDVEEQITEYVPSSHFRGLHMVVPPGYQPWSTDTARDTNAMVSLPSNYPGEPDTPLSPFSAPEAYTGEVLSLPFDSLYPSQYGYFTGT